MTPQSNEKQLVKACLVCNGVRLYYLFSTGDRRVVRCDDCGLVFLNPQPSDDELNRIYGQNYFLGSDNEKNRHSVAEIKSATGRLYLSEICRYRGSEKRSLLEVGCGDGDFLALAEAEGWQVAGIEYSSTACERAQSRLKTGKIICGELQQAGMPSDQFDLCVISDVLEHVRAPLDFLKEIHRVLKPAGVLFIATPSIDSWSARFLRQNWMEFKAEHLTYFDRQTLQTALFRASFRDVIIQPGWKILSFDYIKKHFERFPVPGITPILNFASRFLPKKFQQRHYRVIASGIIALSKKTAVRQRQTLSVIVPTFNEVNTFEQLMGLLLRKELPNLDIEIIIVESNSTDGTRELVLKYKDHPRVKVILEDQPRGKGHAVRTGLKAASGDLILIQDADLEYDLEDYDALLEQLTSGRNAFVLGSRHGGRKVMKMRQFTGQRGLSIFFNIGHWCFTALVNALFFQRLRDPFTMFKVFRRDCLYGLEFECDRFDFDYELLIKLIRKGYQPVELPVNYRSRSYLEGKKVRMFRDPISWLKILIRLRCAKIDPMSIVERKRLAFGTGENSIAPGE